MHCFHETYGRQRISDSRHERPNPFRECGYQVEHCPCACGRGGADRAADSAGRDLRSGKQRSAPSNRPAASATSFVPVGVGERTAALKAGRRLFRGGNRRGQCNDLKISDAFKVGRVRGVQRQSIRDCRGSNERVVGQCCDSTLTMRGPSGHRYRTEVGWGRCLEADASVRAMSRHRAFDEEEDAVPLPAGQTA